jgi:hypothetical protein
MELKTLNKSEEQINIVKWFNFQLWKLNQTLLMEVMLELQILKVALQTEENYLLKINGVSPLSTLGILYKTNISQMKMNKK